MRVHRTRCIVCTAGIAFALSLGPQSVAKADTSNEVFDSTVLQIAGIAAKLTAIYSFYNAINGFLQATHLIAGPTNYSAQLNALSTQINQVAGQLAWFMAESDRETRINQLVSAFNTTSDTISRGGTPAWSVIDLTTGQEVSAGLDATAFERTYIDSVTNGPTIVDQGPSGDYFTWKDVIQYTQTDLRYTNGYVYDWRLGLPALLQLIGVRVQLMPMEDSNFTWDRGFVNELTQYHDALKTQLSILQAGLRCNDSGLVRPGPPDYNNNDPLYKYPVSCADIYSGLNETAFLDLQDPYTSGGIPCCNSDPSGNNVCDQACLDAGGAAQVAWYQANVVPFFEKARSDVRAKTPRFSVQAMLDVLYKYANGLQRELAGPAGQYQGVIVSSPNSSGTHFCLDTMGEGVGLVNCPSVQRWSYNRMDQTITAQGSGLCLDAFSYKSGTPVGLATCNGSNSQKWSYDPEHMVINNGLGNALDVPNANDAPGQLVQTYTWNGGKAQQWPVVIFLNFHLGTGGFHFQSVSRPLDVTKAISGLSVADDGSVAVRTLTTSQSKTLYSGATTISAASFAPAGAGVAGGQWGTNESDMFMVANDGRIYMTSSIGQGAWSAPSALSVANIFKPGGQLATVAQGGQLGVFALDTTGKLEVTWRNPLLGWVGPVAITGPGFAPVGAPLATGTRASGEVDVFVVGYDGGLKYMGFNGGFWTGPYPLTVGSFAPPGAPVATALDVHGFLNVFTVGSDGALYTKWDATPLWSGPTSITATGFAPVGANVAAANYSNNSMDVFVVDNSGTIDALANGGSSWQPATALSDPGASVPGAVLSAMTDPSGPLDVFTTGANGYILESVYSNGTWANPSPLE